MRIAQAALFCAVEIVVRSCMEVGACLPVLPFSLNAYRESIAAKIVSFNATFLLFFFYCFRRHVDLSSIRLSPLWRDLFFVCIELVIHNCFSHYGVAWI